MLETLALVRRSGQLCHEYRANSTALAVGILFTSVRAEVSKRCNRKLLNQHGALYPSIRAAYPVLRHSKDQGERK